MTAHKKIIIGIILAAALIGGYIAWTHQKAAIGLEYRNEQYGLLVKLPDSWKGFTVVTGTYDIFNINTGAQEGSGQVIKLRHPLWTAAHPREDLPIMVFTHANWDRVTHEEISVGAAPIPPTELAHNSQFVFALPARYNYDYKTGWEEVQSIIDAHSISAFEIR